MATDKATARVNAEVASASSNAEVASAHSVIIKSRIIDFYYDRTFERVYLRLANKFVGKHKDENGSIVTGEIDSVSFSPKQLSYYATKLVDELGSYSEAAKDLAAKRGESYNGIPFAVLRLCLKDARITFSHTAFAAGEEYTNADGTVGVCEFDGYRDEPIAIELGADGLEKADRLLWSALEKL